jgi:hypothetical protein
MSSAPPAALAAFATGAACAALAPGAFASDPVPDPVVISTAPVSLFDNFESVWPSGCEGEPAGGECSETLVGIYYPDGMGPPSLGYTNPPAPVFINLHGGNSNPPTPEGYVWHQTNVFPHGFVGVDPNYAVVGPGEDYHVAAASVAHLVQYLRYYHAWLNIDPDRIFLFGRSFGGTLCFVVGLKGDQQDLASPDPQRHESSVPDFLLPFAGFSDMTCFAPTLQFGFFWEVLFPVSSLPGATLEQKVADSAVHWLMHPELFPRPDTPPMFLGYNLGQSQPCGLITDVHDGTFGILMRQKIDEFAETFNDPAIGLASELWDSHSQWGYGADMTEAMDWCANQLAPKEAELYLIDPPTSIGPAGSVQSLKILGAVPGAWVHYFAGFAEGPVSVPACPNVTTGIPAWFYLGADAADAEGRATLAVFAPPAAVGLELVLHAVDVLDCRVSNVLHKTWLD